MQRLCNHIAKFLLSVGKSDAGISRTCRFPFVYFIISYTLLQIIIVTNSRLVQLPWLKSTSDGILNWCHCILTSIVIYMHQIFQYLASFTGQKQYSMQLRDVPYISQQSNGAYVDNGCSS